MLSKESLISLSVVSPPGLRESLTGVVICPFQYPSRVSYQFNLISLESCSDTGSVFLTKLGFTEYWVSIT